jgi:biopolymer transport protein ExbB/TolQ
MATEITGAVGAGSHSNRNDRGPSHRTSGQDALFSLGSLVICAIILQGIWAVVIRPHAEAVLAQGSMVSGGDTSQHAVLQLRSVYVILKDYEQQTSVTLGVWSLLLLLRQGIAVSRHRRLLDRNYINASDERVILPEDARAYSRPLESLPREEQDTFLPRLLTVTLNRFGATRSVQDAAEAVRDECEFEVSSYDAKLSMIRFTVWAIPAVGFVGTVRGIGAALQQAQSAVGGDITGVTLGLGVTFNSTLTALLTCIVVMFCMHQLQAAQDRFVLDARTYVDRRLLRQMRVV